MILGGKDKSFSRVATTISGKNSLIFLGVLVKCNRRNEFDGLVLKSNEA